MIEKTLFYGHFSYLPKVDKIGDRDYAKELSKSENYHGHLQLRIQGYRVFDQNQLGYLEV